METRRLNTPDVCTLGEGGRLEEEQATTQATNAARFAERSCMKLQSVASTATALKACVETHGKMTSKQSQVNTARSRTLPLYSDSARLLAWILDLMTSSGYTLHQAMAPASPPAGSQYTALFIVVRHTVQLLSIQIYDCLLMGCFSWRRRYTCCMADSA